MPKPNRWFTLQIDADGDEFQGSGFASAVIDLLQVAAVGVEQNRLKGSFDNERGRWRLNTPEDYVLSESAPQTCFAAYVNCDGVEFEGDRFQPELARVIRSLIGQVATARWNGALMRHHDRTLTYGNWKTVIGPNYVANPPRKQAVPKAKSPRKRRKT